MPENFYMYFVVALIPLVIGAIYYHQKVLGSAWMKTNNFTEESLKKGNMVVIFGIAYIFSLLIALIMTGMVIHQSVVASMMYPDIFESGSEAQSTFKELMATFGDRHRTFGHGVLHGVTSAVMFALPLIGINALFERRGWKYTLIHFGYWVITLGLMGGVLCQTIQYAPLS